MTYDVRFSNETREHLALLKAHERRSVLDAIERALRFEPMRETKNLKRLRPNPLGRYDLRVGSFRDFFDVIEADTEVLILAVGRKTGSRLRIAGMEIDL